MQTRIKVPAYDRICEAVKAGKTVSGINSRDHYGSQALLWKGKNRLTLRVARNGPGSGEDTHPQVLTEAVWLFIAAIGPDAWIEF